MEKLYRVKMNKNGMPNFSTAEEVELKHGEWDENGNCTNCGEHAPFWPMATTYYRSNFCPNCGADMRAKGADKSKALTRVYAAEEVAEILSDAFHDKCACNFNCNDDWLPFVCKYVEAGDCPDPKDENGCWMQYLLHSRERMKNAEQK